MHVCLFVTASLPKTETRKCRYTHVGFGTPPKTRNSWFKNITSHFLNTHLKVLKLSIYLKKANRETEIVLNEKYVMVRYQRLT